MKTRALLVGAALFLAACSSWHGPAEIKLKNGTILQCPKGLTFEHPYVSCEASDGRSIKVPWSQVAGYSTK